MWLIFCSLFLGSQFSWYVRFPHNHILFINLSQIHYFQYDGDITPQSIKDRVTVLLFLCDSLTIIFSSSISVQWGHHPSEHQGSSHSAPLFVWFPHNHILFICFSTMGTSPLKALRIESQCSSFRGMLGYRMRRRLGRRTKCWNNRESSRRILSTQNEQWVGCFICFNSKSK